MAGGWSRDGAVQDQIDASIEDAVKLARSRLPEGESHAWCEECGDEIPDARRQAVPGHVSASPARQLMTRNRHYPAAITGAPTRTVNCVRGDGLQVVRWCSGPGRLFLKQEWLCYTTEFAVVLRRNLIEETSCQVGVSLSYGVEPQCAEVRVF